MRSPCRRVPKCSTTWVVVGYGVQKKASITGAITNISGEALKVNSTVNTSTALAGTIAGINSRMSDGRPGATTKISIRGMDSPLYIIDGVQRTEAQFNNIDANDIESVSILKDASAAIYGLRAANGVVVVKTKSGPQKHAPYGQRQGSLRLAGVFQVPATRLGCLLRADEVSVRCDQNGRKSQLYTHILPRRVSQMAAGGPNADTKDSTGTTSPQIPEHNPISERTFREVRTR